MSGGARKGGIANIVSGLLGAFLLLIDSKILPIWLNLIIVVAASGGVSFGIFLIIRSRILATREREEIHERELRRSLGL